MIFSMLMVKSVSPVPIFVSWGPLTEDPICRLLGVIQGGGLKVHLSPSCNAVIAAICQLFEWESWPLSNGHDNLHINDHESDVADHC